MYGFSISFDSTLILSLDFNCHLVLMLDDWSP